MLKRNEQGKPIAFCAFDWFLFRVGLKNKTEQVLHTGAVSLRTGFDCYMEAYPEWNRKLFPTLMRCEKTHFWGYLQAPDGRILGLSCAQPIASYQFLYNQKGHRIYTVLLDLLQPLKTPERYPVQSSLLPGEERQWVIHVFPVRSLADFPQELHKHLPILIPPLKKYTVEQGERILQEPAKEATICSDPIGEQISQDAVAKTSGVYRVITECAGYRSESLVYCRKPFAWYLQKAAEAARLQPQKATTHCESWYGLFTGFLAAKHGLASFDEVDKAFCDIMPLMFDFAKGEPLVIPQRIQNTASAISLLTDRYEADPEHRLESLQIADRLSDFLISTQKSDGAFYRNGTSHYTCVIYPAKSLLELYLAERELPSMQKSAEKHFLAAQAAVDDLVRRMDAIGTEGEQTFEDGMISCSALQIAFFAMVLPEEKRGHYTEAAEKMIAKHACLEQNLIPDCRMRGCSLRYWEAQYDVLIRKNMMNSPHGWTAWTLYAKYYLYLLTGKSAYLTGLMDGIGACLQLISQEGVLRWGFICDPCVEAEVFRRGSEVGDLSAGVYEKQIIGESYLPMISGWFRQGVQKLTGGFPSCPLYRKDRTERVDIQGGCCDNDVHEIFKCMEETVFRKAFYHSENGEQIYYSCRKDNNGFIFLEPVDCLICFTDREEVIRIGAKEYRLIPRTVQTIPLEAMEPENEL